MERRVKRSAMLVGAAAAVLAAALALSAIPRRGATPLPSFPQRPAVTQTLPSESRPPDPRLAPAREALKQGRYAAALRHCDAAAAQGVPVAFIEAVRAEIFRETRYLDKEMESYQRWTAADPADAAPWLKLFYIYDDLGWKREADRASRKALELAPGVARSHVARAVFLNRYETADKALTEIDAAQRLDPDNAATSNLRATILLAADRPRDAEAEIRKALRREPGYANHSLVLAQALLSQKRPDEATEVLRALKRREPDNIGAAYQLGLLALEKNDLAEATAQMEFVTRRDAQYENALWHLVSLYRRQGRVQESRPLAALYGRMKRNAETFTATLSRMDERPGDLKTHWQMAGLRMGADEFPQAIVELRAILQFQPDDPDVRRNLITALNRSGRATEARQLAAAAAAGAASKTAAAPGRR